ncbi:NHL repeat-containing protein [Sphingobacterium endophyticum]|uniref:6-bladed beta-propeller n=1 Tax=Sphingobacterium endophyticum TaxID=2546448 RepID=UPI0012E31435|nr:6-bladed beta-propeller [Sphingobacterium endophyticum]
MNRKSFIQKSSILTGGLLIMKDLFAKPKDIVYGHNKMKYTLDKNWASKHTPNLMVKDCHEMVQDKKGRIILLTNETKNNVIVFNKDGKVLESWGHDFPGGHGLTLHNENGTEFLYITDTDKHQVYKTDLSGKILLTIDAPLGVGLYNKKEEFVPTETAVDSNGDIFIADGYGAQHILHYDNKGNLKNHFGGRGEGDSFLDNAHGICFDNRNGEKSLLITDRTRNCFKRFDTSGKLLGVISMPGACVCRPVIKGNNIYAAVLRSPGMDVENSGFVTILDKNNKVISNIGGTEPIYKDGLLQQVRQQDKIFAHPHDVCVDDDENLYVAQWASGKVFPYKLTRV